MSARDRRTPPLVNYADRLEPDRTLEERLDDLRDMARLVDLVARGLAHDETCTTGDHELIHAVSWGLPLLAEHVLEAYQKKTPKTLEAVRLMARRQAALKADR